MKRALPPVHPGEILREDYIKKCGLSITKAADGLGVSRPNLSKILNGKAGISPETAVRLSETFGNSAQFWIDLQINYDIWHAQQKVDRAAIRRFWNESQGLQSV